jgi:hypothetical protein
MTTVIANLYLHDDIHSSDTIDELTNRRATLFIKLNTLWQLNNCLQKVAGSFLALTNDTPHDKDHMPELNEISSPNFYDSDEDMHTSINSDYMDTLTRLVPFSHAETIRQTNTSPFVNLHQLKGQSSIPLIGMHSLNNLLTNTYTDSKSPSTKEQYALMTIENDPEDTMDQLGRTLLQTRFQTFLSTLRSTLTPRMTNLDTEAIEETKEEQDSPLSTTTTTPVPLSQEGRDTVQTTSTIQTDTDTTTTHIFFDSSQPQETEEEAEPRSLNKLDQENASSILQEEI